MDNGGMRDGRQKRRRAKCDFHLIYRYFKRSRPLRLLATRIVCAVYPRDRLDSMDAINFPAFSRTFFSEYLREQSSVSKIRLTRVVYVTGEIAKYDSEMWLQETAILRPRRSSATAPLSR